MNSTEYWEGYHSFNSGIAATDCPYRFNPSAAKDWWRGYVKARASFQST